MSKELMIESEGFLYKLRWGGGGELPQDLNGRYTTAKAAEMAKEEYLARKSKRKPIDGSSKSGT